MPSRDLLRARAQWRAASTFADLCALGERFVSGELAFFPGWNAVGLDVESDEIAPTLARLCRAGFLSVASQPARPHDGREGQRAFVFGFARPAIATALADVRDSGLVVSVYDGSAPSSLGSEPASLTRAEPVSLHEGIAHAFAGHDARADEITCFEDHVSAEALAELRKQAFVSAHDAVWGRTDALWNHIRYVLDHVAR